MRRPRTARGACTHSPFTRPSCAGSKVTPFGSPKRAKMASYAPRNSAMLDCGPKRVVRAVRGNSAIKPSILAHPNPRGRLYSSRRMRQRIPKAKGASPFGNAPFLTSWPTLGGFRLAFDGLQFGSVNRNPAGFLFLRDDTLQLDVKQTVFELGAFDLHVLGKLEPALERAARNAVIEVRGLFGVLALARDVKHAIVHFDVQVFLAEAGHRNGNAIAILFGALDIVGRIALRGVCRIEQVQQPVIADGGTEQGSKIESHVTTSFEPCGMGTPLWPRPYPLCGESHLALQDWDCQARWPRPKAQKTMIKQ